MVSEPPNHPRNYIHKDGNSESELASETDSDNTLPILGRFSDAAMLAADWFWEMDKDLRFTYQSQRFESITGIKISDVIGNTREEAFAGLIDDAEKWQKMGKKLQQQHRYSMIWALKLADGSMRILRTIGKPFFDSNRKFQGYRGIGSDITESVNAYEALEVSEARFRDFDQIAADWFFELDSDLRISYMSGDIHIPSGKKTCEMIGLSEIDWFVEHFDGSEIWRKYLDNLNARKPFELEYQWTREDGEIVYVHNMGKPVFDADRVFQGYRCCGTNITKQRKAEDIARESEQRFRDFAETSADWFWEQDANFKFTYVSEAFYGFRKHSMKDVIGKTRKEILVGLDLREAKWQNLLAKQAAREAFRDFEYKYQLDEDEPIYIRISGKPFYDDKGEFKGYRGSGIDITEAYKLSMQLSYQASHDSLTGLYNRREFERRLSEALKEGREDKSMYALCYIDLDQFKVVNDNCGHQGGDQLLLQITSILKFQIRKNDIVARLGGDEFGLLLMNCPLKQSSMIAEKVRQAIDEYRFIWDGKAFRVGASIGLIPLNADSQDYSHVMREADAACYAAKDAGRNRVHIYHEDNPEVVQRHLEMQSIAEINQAIDDNRLILYYQTILDLNDENGAEPNFFEILVRMQSIDGDLISPGAFLPVAERYNLITQIDTWVVKTTIDWLCREQDEGRPTRCSVNLSGMSIASEKFLTFILKTLELSGVEANRICFEVTETAAITNIDIAMHFIKKLKAKGCFFALDDFGSGFSSFAYLKTLPVDFLKIDGFFVRDILQDSINFEMVKSINDIGHVTGKKTIAESVEDKETLLALKEIGIDYAQGYAIDRPQPINIRI